MSDSGKQSPEPEGEQEFDYTGDWKSLIDSNTINETEAKWGFTVSELEAAVKVVQKLRLDPEIFLNDEALRTTGLWRYINRPPHLKSKSKQVHQQLTKIVRTQKKRMMRENDRKKIAKTEMKIARNEALEKLLTVNPDDQRALLIEDEKGATLKITGEATTPTPLITDGAPKESPGELHNSRKCHICKESFTELHHFYYSLCPPCGAFNYTKRMQTRDLRGKTILLTGARIKIGYQIALRLLRDGAKVLATSRFVTDAYKRFEQEPDFDEWKDRLLLHALDLRDLFNVKQFCKYVISTTPSLFAIVHNAAQTIARPPDYFKNLIEGEQNKAQTPLIAPVWDSYVQKGNTVFKTGIQHALEHKESSSAPVILTDEGTQVAKGAVSENKFYDMYDTCQEASDRRTKNSWTAELGEVSPEEAAEVHAINALSPFIINSALKPILESRPESSPDEKHFIINVSAMEGQFYRFKSTTHPHTNMAKASLNMMTRTSGRDYANYGIYMNSVDTGWITDESPYEKQQRRIKNGAMCPLDEIDAAARVLDLIYIDSKEHSKFWKDFQVIPW